MVPPLTSRHIFRWHWRVWRILGEASPLAASCCWRWLYHLYAVLLQSWITVALALYLLSALVGSLGNSADDLFKTMALISTLIPCVSKSVIIWWKLPTVREVFRLFDHMEQRLRSPEECEYYRRQVLPAARRVYRLFASLCLLVALSMEATLVIGGLLTGRWRLLYPGYLPFDAYASRWHFVAGHAFEFVPIYTQILQNVQNDTLGAMCLALLGGHVHMLGMRASRLGHKPMDLHDHAKRELRHCVEDFETLLRLRDRIEAFLSWCMFIQLLISSANACLVIVYTLFYVHDVTAMIFNTVYILGLGMELFPCCYYGAVYESKIEELPTAIFAADWLGQPREFRLNLRLFMEHTLKRRHTMAGGMFRINLDTFFATCKMAYSLFAVVGQMR